MVIDVSLELFDDGVLQRRLRGVSEYAERELTGLCTTPLDGDENFNVVAPACAKDDASDPNGGELDARHVSSYLSDVLDIELGHAFTLGVAKSWARRVAVNSRFSRLPRRLPG
jgi:hypothetical protein